METASTRPSVMRTGFPALFGGLPLLPQGAARQAVPARRAGSPGDFAVPAADGCLSPIWPGRGAGGDPLRPRGERGQPSEGFTEGLGAKPGAPPRPVRREWAPHLLTAKPPIPRVPQLPQPAQGPSSRVPPLATLKPSVLAMTPYPPVTFGPPATLQFLRAHLQYPSGVHVHSDRPPSPSGSTKESQPWQLGCAGAESGSHSSTS